MATPEDIRRELGSLQTQLTGMKNLSKVFVGLMSLAALGFAFDALLGPPFAGIANTLVPAVLFTLVMWLLALTHSTQKIVEAVYNILEQTEDIV